MDGGRLGPIHRLKRPVRRTRVFGLFVGLDTPYGPGPNPFRQGRHLVTLQRSRGRHFQLTRSTDSLDQKALVRFPGNDS